MLIARTLCPEFHYLQYVTICFSLVTNQLDRTFNQSWIPIVTSSKMELNSPWLKAFASTLCISLLPNVLLFAIPMRYMTGPIRGIHLKQVMISFASGGLLGDVFLHTIPHLLGHHDNFHDHSHHDHHYGPCTRNNPLKVAYRVINSSTPGMLDNVWGLFANHPHSKELLIGAAILFGFFLFLMAEKIARVYFSHNHFHCVSQEKKEEQQTNEDQEGAESKGGSSSKTTVRRRRSSSNSRTSKSKTRYSKKWKVEKAPAEMAESPMLQNLEISGWLNLSADSLHNFTDGLAIGAAFSARGGGGVHCHSHGHHRLGLATALSVLFHEVPHEIGDFVTLINSGMTKLQAIHVQFVTALFAFAGAAFGVLGGQVDSDTRDLLMSFTSGGFLYIATCGLLNSTLSSRDENKSGLINKKKQVIFDGLAFFIGIGVMIGVALLE